MSWRDLTPFPDDWCEPERPHVQEEGRAVAGAGGYGGHVVLTFGDDVSRQWYAEWLRSKRGWAAFMTWLDEKR